MLKVLEGVQEYERFPTKPRAYQPDLSVLLQCETKPKLSIKRLSSLSLYNPKVLMVE